MAHLKIKSQIEKSGEKYFAYYFKAGELEKSKVEVRLKDYHLDLLRTKPTAKFKIEGNLLDGVLFVGKLSNHNKGKRSVTSHKPVYDGTQYNPMKGKSKSKIGYGINTSKKSIKNQIIEAYKNI